MSGLLLEKKKKSSIPPPISAEQTALSPFPEDEIPKIPPNKVGANNVFVSQWPRQNFSTCNNYYKACSNSVFTRNQGEKSQLNHRSNLLPEPKSTFPPAAEGKPKVFLFSLPLLLSAQGSNNRVAFVF